MRLVRDEFAEVLGTSFVLTVGEDRTVDIKLTEVSPVRDRPHQVSFSMLFKLPADQWVEQGLYDLKHESFGTFELFLVPIGQDPDGFVLEAVINRLKDGESEISG
jgi:hypothetical protein